MARPFYVRSAEGVSVIHTEPCGYRMPDPGLPPRLPPRRATVRSAFTGYDSDGQRYELVPAMYDLVWKMVRHLPSVSDSVAPTSAAQCKALLVSLFGHNDLTARYGGFRVPNTTRRAVPTAKRSYHAACSDDPVGYWDTEITASPRKRRAPR